MLNKIVCAFCIIAMLAMCVSCSSVEQPIVDITPNSAAASSPGPTLSPTPTESVLLTPSPKPTTMSASLGFVGDIMIMQNQVKSALQSDGSYDFTRSFEPMRELFNSVDILCGNLEVPLAGESATYSGPAPTRPPATEDNPNSQKPYQTFNAPDELARNLYDLGFDVLTTANNHCLDRGIEGLRRTIRIIREAGLLQTGTFLSKNEVKPLIVEVNGIKIGIVAFSGGFNTFNRNLSEEDLHSISYLYDTEYVKAMINACKEEGADYIIAFPHCGDERVTTPPARVVQLFRDLVSWGADAIIASHPHVVQPIEWLEIERAGKTIKAPIVYSLGNFIANMSTPCDYGMFVKLELEKDQTGTRAVSISYLPVYCIKQYVSGRVVHQTLPCYTDTSRITAIKPLSKDELNAIETCRQFVIDICGKEFLMSEE